MPKKILKTQPTINNKRAAGSFRVFRLRWSVAASGNDWAVHLAILFPTRTELADALRRLMKAGIPLEGASDHGVSEALYLRDPDDNGVELYWDRRREEWPRESSSDFTICDNPDARRA